MRAPGLSGTPIGCPIGRVNGPYSGRPTGLIPVDPPRSAPDAPDWQKRRPADGQAQGRGHAVDVPRPDDVLQLAKAVREQFRRLDRALEAWTDPRQPAKAAAAALDDSARQGRALQRAVEALTTALQRTAR
jgi:hypothetical protein